MKRVALGRRISFSESVPVLGVRLNWDEYNIDEQKLLWEADLIYYPSRLYEQFFKALGKKVFPRNYCEFIGNKIRQTLLFEWLAIPHPRTRIYYGKVRKEQILQEFSYPFIAKDPVGSSQGRGVFLISSEEDLGRYLENHHPAYIQEYLPVDRDLRVVVLGSKAVHAYWRIGRTGEFRHNVSQGADISFKDIPPDALAFAENVSNRCGFDDVGLDMIIFNGALYVIEANMVYGQEGFRRCGKELKNMLIEIAGGEFL
ncbi:MAG: hypothetical protein WHS38_11870 [Thermodesulforhabdaceae bacterium]|jgi:ribosomal protein S6--L-glutamate ligase